MFRFIRGWFVLFMACFALAGQAQDFEALKQAAITGDAKALGVIQRVAEQGNAEGQYHLGDYYVGKGNYDEAKKWFRKAAEQGYAPASRRLAGRYSVDSRAAGNKAEAVKWYRKAAEQGDAISQNELGNLYANKFFDSGVARNDAEAVKWYRKAAEQGYVDAQNSLGFMYASGRGVTRDFAEAVKWYRKAAEQGDDIAAYRLAEHYAHGLGVTKNEAEAVKWYGEVAGYSCVTDNLSEAWSNSRASIKMLAKKGNPDARKMVKKLRLDADDDVECM